MKERKEEKKKERKKERRKKEKKERGKERRLRIVACENGRNRRVLESSEELNGNSRDRLSG